MGIVDARGADVSHQRPAWKEEWVWPWDAEHEGPARDWLYGLGRLQFRLARGKVWIYRGHGYVTGEVWHGTPHKTYYDGSSRVGAHDARARRPVARVRGSRR